MTPSFFPSPLLLSLLLPLPFCLSSRRGLLLLLPLSLRLPLFVFRRHPERSEGSLYLPLQLLSLSRLPFFLAIPERNLFLPPSSQTPKTIASRHPKASALGLSHQPKNGALAPGVGLSIPRKTTTKLAISFALASVLLTSCDPPKPTPKTTPQTHQQQLTTNNRHLTT
jgi:hypothetical protein